ncbi:MAG: lysophospholipid acyltransferase family protein [Fibrobacterota bacterium]
MNAVLRQFFWYSNRVGSALFLKRKFNISLDTEAEKLPPPPYIIVSNHANFFDPWIVAHYTPKSAAIMMNEFGFNTSRITKKYLEMIGCFAKKKGQSDSSSVKKAMKSLRSGHPLLIFPEGQASWSGKTQPIYPGIERIAKKTQVPLVIYRMTGNFVSNPWWSTGPARKGTIKIHRHVLSAEEVKKRSPESLRRDIIAGIANNDVKECSTHSFSGSELTRGMENVLWLCPHCKFTDALETGGDQCRCSHCGTRYHFSPSLQVSTDISIPSLEDFYDWTVLQKEYILHHLSAAESSREVLISNSGISQVKVDYRGRPIMLDTGTLHLSSDTLVFEGEDGRQTFDCNEIHTPVFQGKDILEFDYKKSNYQFRFASCAVYKWLTYLLYMKGYEQWEETGYIS